MVKLQRYSTGRYVKIIYFNALCVVLFGRNRNEYTVVIIVVDCDTLLCCSINSTPIMTLHETSCNNEIILIIEL